MCVKQHAESTGFYRQQLKSDVKNPYCWLIPWPEPKFFALETLEDTYKWEFFCILT